MAVNTECMDMEISDIEKVIRAFELRFRERFSVYALATDVMKAFRIFVTSNNLTMKEVYDLGNNLLMSSNNQILRYLNV